MADPAACLLLALEINSGLKALLPVLLLAAAKTIDSSLASSQKVHMQFLYVSEGNCCIQILYPCAMGRCERLLRPSSSSHRFLYPARLMMNSAVKVGDLPSSPPSLRLNWKQGFFKRLLVERENMKTERKSVTVGSISPNSSVFRLTAF